MLGRLREAKTVADAVLDRIAGVLAGGDRIELRGFDAISTKFRAPRWARNARTGTTVSPEERSGIAFRPGREMVRGHNDGSEAPAAGFPSGSARRVA
ncbi:HU family DNA-binding protein [Methylobacterium sp. CM6257]